MHFSVICIIVITAFIATLISGTTGKVPLWVCVLLFGIAQLLECLALK